MPKRKPTPLIILGMHRSGTSCLAGAVEQAGVYLGEVSKYNQYNKKGNRENARTMQLNEEILIYNHASWDNPPHTLKWNKDHEKQGKAIINDLIINCQSNYWGFKDPRVLLTLPFWKRLLPDAQFIGTYRNPISVAKSLNNRANFSIDLQSGLDLWAKYNQHLITFYNEKSFPLISFDLSAKLYENKLRAICSLLKLSKLEKIDFFDPELRNQKNINKPNDINPEFERIYNRLNELSDTAF